MTGWKGLFVNRGFTKKINELTKSESDNLLEFLFDHISSVSYSISSRIMARAKIPSPRSIFAHPQNHDLQVRFRWEENSLAIWDNRSTFRMAHSLHHPMQREGADQTDAATQDLDTAKRTGTRSVSIGERPYFDPSSISRRDALAQAAEAAKA